MGRHAAPDPWAFWRSFAKAVGGALLALLLTVALVLLLVDMGQARIGILPGQRMAEEVDPSPSPGPGPVRPEASEPRRGDAAPSEERDASGRASAPVEPVGPDHPDQDEPAGPDGRASPAVPRDWDEAVAASDTFEQTGGGIASAL